MNFREHIAVFLSFSKKERRGIYLLLTICMLLWIVPVFFSSEKIPDDILTITPLAITKAKHVLQVRADSIHNKPMRRGFYENKRFAVHPHYADDLAQQEAEMKQPFAGRMKKPIDINRADSIALERLPGIGEKLSSRIIHYRDRLGGFIALSQVREVYGLSDSVMNLITPMLLISDQFQPSKIDLNKAEYADLRKHPYITHALARSLLAYRKANGPFNLAEELNKIISIGKDEASKIIPYLKCGD